MRAKRSGKNQNTKVTLCAKSFAAHFRIAGIAEFRSLLSEAIGEIPIECRDQTFGVNKSLSRTIYNLSIDASRKSRNYKHLLFRALDERKLHCSGIRLRITDEIDLHSY